MASIASEGGPMKDRPDSEHFWANVAFSLSYEESGVELAKRLQINIQSHTQDVFHYSHAFWQLQLFCRHPDTPKHHPG